MSAPEFKVGDKVTTSENLYDGYGMAHSTAGELEIVALDDCDACVMEPDGDIHMVRWSLLKPVPTTETITITAERADLDRFLVFYSTQPERFSTRKIADAIEEARS